MSDPVDRAARFDEMERSWVRGQGPLATLYERAGPSSVGTPRRSGSVGAGGSTGTPESGLGSSPARRMVDEEEMEGEAEFELVGAKPRSLLSTFLREKAGRGGVGRDRGSPSPAPEGADQPGPSWSFYHDSPVDAPAMARHSSGSSHSPLNCENDDAPAGSALAPAPPATDTDNDKENARPPRATLAPFATLQPNPFVYQSGRSPVSPSAVASSAGSSPAGSTSLCATATATASRPYTRSQSRSRQRTPSPSPTSSNSNAASTSTTRSLPLSSPLAPFPEEDAPAWTGQPSPALPQGMFESPAGAGFEDEGNTSFETVRAGFRGEGAGPGKKRTSGEWEGGGEKRRRG